MKTAALVILIVIIGVVTGIYAPRVIRWMEIDRCLDAGGRFNYQTNECEGARH